MAQTQIIVNNLTKVYRVPEREEGLVASLRDLVRRRYLDVVAVKEVSFSIDSGEIVGFIGPNGAGKTTTLKILAGLLYPTTGQVSIAGFTPWDRKHEYLRTISMVLGNKSQMIWDIPPKDSFRVLAEIYSVPKSQYERVLEGLVDLLEMAEVLQKPVRNLSLGERMKCELIAGLLYSPKVLFLDEPTLGLDVSMQAKLRAFLKTYNQRTGSTTILTSHYMGDVTALCSRIIFIHHGRIIYDGGLPELTQKLAPFKIIRLSLQNGDNHNADKLKEITQSRMLSSEDGKYEIRVERERTAQITARLLNEFQLYDLSVEDPPVEAVIDQMFQETQLENDR